ncbi:MAG: hypothetical protein GX112_15230 [Clostridiaceae bacterium]|nr:hypothetical protein [Clostridiaceae bacterium]
MPGLYTDLIIHTLSMTINALPMSNLIYWGSLQVRVDIKQENTPVYSHEWQDPPAHLVHAPNKRVTLAAGKAVSCRFSVASITEPFSASFYMFLDMSEGGPVRTAQLVCSSFTLAAGELATLDVVYQVVPADSRLLKATAARVTLLEWTPPYQVLVASRLARCPLEDTFFYHDPNIVLLAEQEARQKETSLLVAPDLLPGDVFREIIEHYTLEPIVEPDPFPDPFDSLVTDSVWERVSGAIKTGLDDRSASGQQVRQLLDDPATVVAIGKTSYQREANYAVALNNVAPAAAVSNNSPVYRSGRSGQTAQLQAGSSVALGQKVSA